MGAELQQGFLAALEPLNLLAGAAGVVIGLVVGMLPGITISAGIIIVLPLTFVLPPSISIALLLGVYAAGMTGGAFSAILLNIPGTPSASATILDGYPLARRGEPGRALGISIAAGFIGGLFSFFCLLLIAPLLARLALRFQAPDLFALMLFGLAVICSFSTRSLAKGLISAVLGLMIMTVGQDPVMGTARFNFGSANALAGINFLSALIGLFAIPQILDNVRDGVRAGGAPRAGLGRVLPGWVDLARIRLSSMIGAAVGTFIGILPGAGGPIAAFISYDYARKASRNPAEFGHGSIEGIAAPESANNAVTGGALVPMMTLGIPGDPITAILIGALLVHGLAPGPMLFVNNAQFAYTTIFLFFWANVLTLALSFACIRPLVRLLDTPRALLLPGIALLCVVGSYAIRNSLFDVYAMLAFGVLGLLLRWLDIPVVPLLIAMVLGPQLEEHLRVALTASSGDLSVFLTSPFSATFLALAVLSAFWSLFAGQLGRKEVQA